MRPRCTQLCARQACSLVTTASSVVHTENYAEAGYINGVIHVVPARTRCYDSPDGESDTDDSIIVEKP